jgi:hypothetical protein
MRIGTDSVVMVLSVFVALGNPVWAAWTEPLPVTEIHSTYHDKAPFLSYDGRTLYFSRNKGLGRDFTRLYQATRDAFSGSLVVSEISTLTEPDRQVDYPWVSVDNLRMYYYIAYGTTRKLMITERESVDDRWMPGVGVAELNTLGDVANPSLTPDELTICFTGTEMPKGEGGYDIWMATRPDKESPFGNVTNLTEINSLAWDFHPRICPDGLTVYFASRRNETSQLFKATRASVDAPFGAPEHLSFLDSPGASLQYPFLSSDGTALYFVRWPDGGMTDIYVSYICDDFGAQTFYVDAINGDDFNTGLSSEAPFASIQKGIDAAKDGDSVLVCPGVYTGQVGFRGKAVTLRSIADAAMLENPDGIAVSIHDGEGPDSVLKNFVIANSSTAICIARGSPTISNVTVVGNTYGIDAYAGAEPDISNSIFWDNTRADLIGCQMRYSCAIEPGTGQGNIDGDPLFVDPNNGDYHLRSERGRYWPLHDVWVLDKVTSPCIDGGDPSGEPMPNSGRTNMGAYGGTRYASMSEVMPVDFNTDGVVDMSDLADMIETWLEAAGWKE